MSEYDDLQERLASLEDLVHTLAQNNTASSRLEIINDAKVSAIYSIVLELAEHLGVNPAQFFRHYETRFRWWHDYYLRQAEDVSPEISGLLDPRTIEQASVSEVYLPLFDPPQSDNKEGER
jgi:hypothetical protein